MLFSNITEIKNFLPIGAGNDFFRLKPHIENAEKKYILPLLGREMYDEINAFYKADFPAEPTDPEKDMKELLLKTQHALIHLAYFIGFDFLNVQVTDSGFQRVESDRTKGLFHYQEQNLKKYFSDSGFNGLDDVLVFLEDNIRHFREFEESENYTVLKTSFLPTVKDTEAIPFNLNGSRLLFLALRPMVAYVEDMQIRRLLGKSIYNEVKEELKKDNPAEKVVKLLPYIRKPLIYLASAFFMEETGASLDEKGLFFEKTDAVYRGQQKREPSTEERIAAMIARNRKIGNDYMEELAEYLGEEWNHSAGKWGMFRRDNTGKKSFWA